MIRSVLFDFDDTLGDYKGAQEKAKKIISVFLNQKTIDPAAFWNFIKEMRSCFSSIPRKKSVYLTTAAPDFALMA